MATARAVYDLAVPRYVQFVCTEISSKTEGPIDQSLLVAFVELVKRQTTHRAADVGCGPGRAASFMATRGLDVVGVDVSEAMLAIARNAHPHIKFEERQLDALRFITGVLAGAVCWYSIIYTPLGRLAEAFGELARVLIPGGLPTPCFSGGGRAGPQHRCARHASAAHHLQARRARCCRSSGG